MGLGKWVSLGAGIWGERGQARGGLPSHSNWLGFRCFTELGFLSKKNVLAMSLWAISFVLARFWLRYSDVAFSRRPSSLTSLSLGTLYCRSGLMRMNRRWLSFVSWSGAVFSAMKVRQISLHSRSLSNRSVAMFHNNFKDSRPFDDFALAFGEVTSRSSKVSPPRGEVSSWSAVFVPVPTDRSMSGGAPATSPQMSLRS